MSVGETRKEAAPAEARMLDVAAQERLLWGALSSPVSEEQKTPVPLNLSVFICRKQE